MRERVVREVSVRILDLARALLALRRVDGRF